MNEFSIAGAWSLGFRFIARHWLAHSLILILLGIVAPFALQYAMVGGPIDVARPGAFTDGTAGTAGWTPLYLLAAALGGLLQVGSYLTSLRVGFGAERSAVGGLDFGFAAGLIAIFVIAAAHLLAYFVAKPLVTADTLLLAVAAFLLPLAFVYALFFIGQALFVAASVILLVVFLMGYGAIMGAPDLAATFFAGSGSIAVFLLVLGAVLFWVAARLSCTTALMAERKSLNLFAAIRDSWRLTWEEQWGIARYLALVGLIPAALVVAVSIAAGGSLTSFMPEAGLGATILRAALTIPFAFLSVMLPAGIYRQLAGVDETDAAVFD